MGRQSLRTAPQGDGGNKKKKKKRVLDGEFLAVEKKIIARYMAKRNQLNPK
jgi:hypothetical protein